MVNIWEYANSFPKVRIKTKDGGLYVGYTLMVWDADESNDDEHSITIELNSGETRSFYPSEIESIEKIK